MVEKMGEMGTDYFDGKLYKEARQALSGTVYFWADNQLRTGKGHTIIDDMTKVIKMTIKILNDDYDESLKHLIIHNCLYELLDTLTKCFGGCLRCKKVMFA
jgi:hypothetical protein